MNVRLAVLSLAFTVSAALPAAAQLVAQERDVSVSTYFLDSVWGEDPVTDSDQVASPFSGAFQATLAVDSASLGSEVYADAEQFSSVDAAAADVNAQGFAAAGLYVQGTGSALAESRLRIDVVLVSAGALLIDGELNTTNDFLGLFSHDDHGTASAEVRVEEAGSGTLVFLRRVELGQPGIDLQGTTVPLTAGAYTVTIEALAADATVGVEQVNGSMAAGVYDVQLLVTGSGPLVADTDSVSLGSGGPQNLALDAGAAFAALSYLVVGSASGTAPGFLLGELVLPLNLDAYSLFSIANAGGPLYPGSVGVLDGAGQAAAAVQVPTGLSPTLAGTTLHHAFLVLNGGAAVFASDPAPLALIP